jgi:hypothetical protein
MPAMATSRKMARTRLRQLPTVVREGLRFKAEVWTDMRSSMERRRVMEKKREFGDCTGIGVRVGIV